MKFEGIKMEAGGKADLTQLEIPEENIEAREYINGYLERYQSVAKRLGKIVSDPLIKDDGDFVGGLGAREGGRFVISVNARLFKKGFEEKLRDVFTHEFGHAVYQHTKDVIRFFNYHKLDLPKNLAEMDRFIKGLPEPGMKNLIKDPKAFLDNFVGFAGEASPDNHHDKLVEKFAEIFLSSQKGKDKKIVKQFKEIFAEDKVNTDWAADLEDEESQSKWDRFFAR